MFKVPNCSCTFQFMIDLLLIILRFKPIGSHFQHVGIIKKIFVRVGFMMIRFKDMVDIKETLIKLRKAKGVTATQLCKETGISTSTARRK